MIVCLSVSHKKAKLPLLESLVIPNEDKVMKAICSGGLAQECLLLQTCHRVEMYCVVNDAAKDSSIKAMLRFWSSQTGVSADLLSETAEILNGKEALTHLFYLAAGLESMVVGEDQILGQVRTAYVKAKKLGTLGLILDKVCMKAINTGRRVRTETRINEGSVSLSSAAVDLAAKDLGQLESKRALVIGAGEAGSIAAETLRRRGTKSIIIANRTYERGQELASRVSGEAIELSQVYEAIPKVDLVIVAISVEKPILQTAHVRKVQNKHARSKRLYVVDISQPRAVDEKIASLQGVVLKNIDDLKGIVDESIRNRLVEAEKAKEIIQEELARLERQLSSSLVEPVISRIHRKVESIRLEELGRATRKMGESDKKKLAIIDRFSRELIERVLQIPLEQLRKASLDNNTTLLSIAERLFQIESEKGEGIE